MRGIACSEATLLLSLFIAVATAGPHGPAASDVRASDTGLMMAACDDSFPYDLSQVPGNTDLLHLFNPRRSYGSTTMVDALLEAAGVVAARYPNADPLFIGDLSTHKGGALPPHRWHHDGRSADVGLFFAEGQQPQHGFERVWPSQLDVERTWATIEAMLSTGNVEHILLDEGLIRKLKAYVREEGLLDEAQIRATFPPKGTRDMWRMRGIVRHASHHYDHMHLRVVCAAP